MKQINRNFKIAIMLFIAVIFTTSNSFAIKPSNNEIDFENKQKLSLNKMLESELNRKLSFTERIALQLLNKKLKKHLTAVVKIEAECATIIMKNGDIVEAELIQINSKNVKYRRCNTEDEL